MSTETKYCICDTKMPHWPKRKLYQYGWCRVSTNYPECPSCSRARRRYTRAKFPGLPDLRWSEGKEQLAERQARVRKCGP